MGSGLSRGQRLGAWAVAIGGVGAWEWYNHRKSVEAAKQASSWTSGEQEEWNKQVLRKQKEDAAAAAAKKAAAAKQA
jgi:hypothetical protein